MNRRDFIKESAAAGASAGVALSSMGLPGCGPTTAMAAGFAERDITPSLGMEIPGGYRKAFHRKFHDPCKVRAAVFDDGKNRVALVGLDALVVPREIVTTARSAISQQCGIAEEAVLIGASHSHSSGPVGMVQPGQYDHASPFVQKLAYEESSCANAAYLLRVQTSIVDAVCEANDRRVETKCGFGLGKEDKVGFNRRLRMKNGLTYSHPGKGNPEIIEYAGPIDPEVGVIGAWDTHGELMGCVVHYSCHATTSPGGISANWIYYLEQAIQGAMGDGVNVVFLQGDCGDVTQVDNLSPYVNPTRERWAQYVGGCVGAEAVKVLLTIHPGEFAPVAGATTVWNSARRIPSPDRVKRCYELVKKGPEEAGATDWTFAKEIVLLDALIAKEPEVEVEVQALQVGPAVFLARPGEMFVEYGLDLKKRCQFPFTFPVELANGIVGYVPTEEAMSKTGGGYETRLTSYSNLEVAAGRKMSDAAIKLTSQMTPGEVPQAPPAPPFKGPWTYGNVPPELS